MLTIHDWFSLVKDNDLRKHLLEKLEETRGSKDFECYSFSQALTAAFAWDINYLFYVNLHNNPPKLKNTLIYKIKKLLKETKNNKI